MFRGAKKRTFRFGKKNVSFPKVETFRFADYNANYIIAIKENKKKNYQPAKQIIDDYQDRDEIINRVIRHVSEKCRTWKD